ncbi:transposase, partial [Cerasicoccus arenae]|nr:transposase [Cerasicoccus arenae]
MTIVPRAFNRELIYTLSEARFIFKEWMNFYNNIRPHRSL